MNKTPVLILSLCMLATVGGCGPKPSVADTGTPPPEKDRSAAEVDQIKNAGAAKDPANDKDSVVAAPDSLEALLNGLPQNARPHAIDDSLAYERANAWIKANILGKRIAVPHPLKPMLFTRTDDAPHYTVNVGGPFGVNSAVPLTVFGVAHKSMVYSEQGLLGGSLVFRGVDEALADRLRGLQGKTGVITGRLDSCSFQVPLSDDESMFGASLLVKVSALKLDGRLINRSTHVRDVGPGQGNPFAVPTEAVPDDVESRAFADKANLQGGPDDDNAQSWAKTGKTPAPGKLDGEWEGRWRSGGTGAWVPNTAPVRIATVGKTVYILWKDRKYNSMLVGVRDGDRLIGRSADTDDAEDASVWSGLVVDDARIDGAWLDNDGTIRRWDFRRVK